MKRKKREFGPLFFALNDVRNDLDFEQGLKNQRNGIPQCYDGRDSIAVYLSKAGIEAIATGDIERALRYRANMISAWARLKNIDVPADIGWQFDGEAAQEMVEFDTVLYAHPLIFGGGVILPSFPTPEDYVPSEDDPDFNKKINYRVTTQAWLAGVADAPGELGKMAYQRLLDDPLPFDARADLMGRYINVAKDILEFLNQFVGIGIPDQIMNSSRRRGFHNTYRGKVWGVKRIIEKSETELAQLKNLASIHESYGLTKKEVA